MSEADRTDRADRVESEAADCAADGRGADRAADGRGADRAADGRGADRAADGRGADRAADGRGADRQRWRPRLRARPGPGVCERCGATEHVHEGLCRRCRHALAGEATPAAEEHLLAPHQAPTRSLRRPPWRRRGA